MARSRRPVRTTPDHSARTRTQEEPADKEEKEENSARLTFFLRETDYQSLRLQVACFKVSSAQTDPGEEPLPLTPSALLREVVQYWLEHFPIPTGTSRMDTSARRQRMQRMIAAVKQMKG